ncbi:chemotaxis protein [Desulfuromonas acetoxidans]|uniref:chemotaxis protein n=1 Tax=Desulfuromonas acetoxidans TaxID=891 RepID=UPI001593F400|nr:chemotaxis protein [Desulfuromonas acetoxidans]MBF0645466.1 chemotaxis protein CheV [Desulfuromonas acetoxidans]NVD25333.1 chemotaxis protein CheV [Desulfuromonas acetoxidans]NVE17385.1 chemotaxis protein CheV [Desulfuromonas acetoxidans]
MAQATMQDKQGILLEAGTNEFEILEYYLFDQSFGINVHKLREIVPFCREELTTLPDSHPSLLGTLLLRGDTIPLVSLADHIGKHLDPAKVAAASDSAVQTRQVVLVCEFNDEVISFLVDGVDQIHRLSWSQVKPMDQFFESYRPRFTGTVTVGERDILIVDMEHIAYEIFGDGEHYAGGDDEVEASSSRKENRADVKLFFAEDSAIIRQGIMRVLKKAGYDLAQSYGDGLACWNAVQQAKEEGELPALVVSDIEMPELDGLALCRRIKEDQVLRQIKVVMYSSLINENTSHKCVEVGADDFTSKPDVTKVVALVDKYCLVEE